MEETTLLGTTETNPRLSLAQRYLDLLLGARRQETSRLILDAVAKVESIEVTEEEIDARIARDAERMGEKVEALRARLREHSGQQALVAQMVREKSLDYLTSIANIHYAD